MAINAARGFKRIGILISALSLVVTIVGIFMVANEPIYLTYAASPDYKDEQNVRLSDYSTCEKDNAVFEHPPETFDVGLKNVHTTLCFPMLRDDLLHELIFYPSVNKDGKFIGYEDSNAPDLVEWRKRFIKNFEIPMNDYELISAKWWKKLGVGAALILIVEAVFLALLWGVGYGLAWIIRGFTGSSKQVNKEQN